MKIPPFQIKTIILSVIAIAFVPIAAMGSPSPADQSVARGKAIYEQTCIFCHGEEGKGDGPAAFFIGAYSAPRPRDFSSGAFKFRSTPSGEMPTDQDLFRTITEGIPGFMLPFRGLTAGERWDVVAYLKTFSPDLQEDAPIPIRIPFPKIPPSNDSIDQGRDIYQKFACAKCHGENGQGVGFLADNLRDTSGLPIRPTDLTNLPSFKNGATPRDIARSILTGLNGTPMPSYFGALSKQREDIWHIVNFILSFSEE